MSEERIKFDWFDPKEPKSGARFSIDPDFRYAVVREIWRDVPDGSIEFSRQSIVIEVTALVDLIEKLNGLVQDDLRLQQGVELSTLTRQRLINLIPTTRSMPVADFLD
jgi:hypothetical protein